MDANLKPIEYYSKQLSNIFTENDEDIIDNMLQNIFMNQFEAFHFIKSDSLPIFFNACTDRLNSTLVNKRTYMAWNQISNAHQVNYDEVLDYILFKIIILPYINSKAIESLSDTFSKSNGIELSHTPFEMKNVIFNKTNAAICYKKPNEQYCFVQVINDNLFVNNKFNYQMDILNNFQQNFNNIKADNAQLKIYVYSIDNIITNNSIGLYINPINNKTAFFTENLPPTFNPFPKHPKIRPFEHKIQLF